MYLNPRFTQGGRDFGTKIWKHLTVPKNAQFCNLKTWGRGWGLPLRSAPLTLMQVLEFLTNCPQHKNANIANFVLPVPLEISWTNEILNLET